jgi:tripartite motif-containing protein 71
MYPYGIALDPRGGYLNVSDQYNYRICKFTLTGDFVLTWGSNGSGDGQFGITIGLAVDPSGNVYVADAYNNRVQVFSDQGAFVRKWGHPGSGDGEFDQPRDVCVTSHGEIVVTDCFNNRVERFTPQGDYLGQWSCSLGSVVEPHGIVEDGEGNFLITGVTSGTLTKWSPSGAFITTLVSNGTLIGQLGAPAGLALDQFGNIYVAEFFNNRVQKFSASGQSLSAWGPHVGTAPGLFDRPADIAIGPDGSVYVVDLGNSRIQEFGYQTVAARRIAWGALKAHYR